MVYQVKDLITCSVVTAVVGVAAVVRGQSLAWELPHAESAAKKKKKSWKDRHIFTFGREGEATILHV